MTDAELLDLNQQGFIPGPSELEEDFLSRVARVRKIFETGDWIPLAHWEWVRLHLKQIFDFEPVCLPAFYSNRSLRAWQGAAAWIEGTQISSIQLRESLRKGSYLGLYKREEILAHEAVHAARSAFQELGYEELFAYMTSEKRWHRILGPIISKPWEIWPFFLNLGLGTFFPLSYFLASLWASMGFWRLVGKHRKLQRASQNILSSVHDPKKVRAILFRLTDDEIVLFSKGKKIEDYGKDQKSLRWRLISMAYLTN